MHITFNSFAFDITGLAVEAVRGLDTDDATTQKIMEVCQNLKKVPVEVNDYPGFVANRILMPMINEAVYCLMEGVATKEAIDEVMKLGPPEAQP